MSDKHKPKPGTVSFVHPDPVRHADDGRGTAGTARLIGGSIVPVAGIRVHPYPSGTATWDLTCPCGVNARATDYALMQAAESKFSEDPGARRVAVNIMDLYSY